MHEKYQNIIEYLRASVETTVFGVCTRMGNRLGIPSRHVRLFFVYATFIATFSPVILYLILAFWVKLKDYIAEQVSPVRDL